MTVLVLAKGTSLANLSVYKIVYSGVDEKPEGSNKLLKTMVGASGFEPPTSWSRTMAVKNLSR